MKSTDIFPSKYLKAEELDGDAIVVIERVELEKFTDPQTKQESTKPVAHFKDCDKGLILNKTNWAQIAKQHGDDSDDWIGKEITLFTMEVEAFGDIVQAIRVKGPKPKPVAGKGIGRKPTPATEEAAPANNQDDANAEADAAAAAGQKKKARF